ncbi:aea58ddd-961b-42bd-a764-46c14742b786 [Sclerotinia trifoliorum]|uniref:Aea58ddd-961b-42bd-a764-46c14742b786 n=1 Tax=Sclerotinia trifoliorum TaxID=28548 RepID=A0A8H2VV37_9HELO|nr:aea58ddd-961b-42bd-a764-46c14742b786 [Sclerotinia trifoliorum]
MEAESLDNDTRGWIMAVISGIACVIGSCIICIDILIRHIPSKKNFRIQDSNAFLAASLSLSFGVMIFSSLYSMLPSSKKYLIEGGYTAHAAAWILLACFAAGFIGIQFVSRLMHHFIPSHVSHCDHSHEPNAAHHDHNNHFEALDGHHDHSLPLSKSSSHVAVHQANSTTTESTPLLMPSTEENGKYLPKGLALINSDSQPNNHRQSAASSRRPSLMEVQARVMSFVKDRKANCDESGPCFGFSDLCGRECLRTPINTRPPYTARTPTGTLSTRSHPFTLPEEEEESQDNSTRSHEETEMASCQDSDIEAQQHHHHVPENAFMDIGLQTSIAIGLHKLPEGFITFATNHANPELGVSVFLALLVHNITEGFAMALPLYLALGSRPRAIFWSSLFGGVSQPAGAGIAAAWFSISGREGHAPNIVVYGCMFGVTGGIMASVALHLFAECLGMNHNRSLCISFAFVGMALMGMSNALTSE